MATDQVNGASQEALVSPEELARVLHQHELYLLRQPGGQCARMHSRNLASVDLSNHKLAEANLTACVLYGANLRFADLERASLYCADLRNIDGRYANFSRADMRGVTLKGSKLSHAKLDHADLRAGRLVRAGLWGAEEIVDRNGCASGVDFSFCTMRGTTLEGANLKGASFNGAFIQGVKFKGARLYSATFEGAILMDVELSELQVPREALKNCVLPPTPDTLTRLPHLLAALRAHQRWIESDARSGSCASLDGEDLRPLAGEIGKFKLTALSARNVIAAGIDFSGAELQGADFEGADLRCASFEGSDIRGANFRNARLLHVKFMGADIRPLQLRSGGTKTCDFTGANMSSEQMAEAVFD